MFGGHSMGALEEIGGKRREKRRERRISSYEEQRSKFFEAEWSSQGFTYSETVSKCIE